MNKNCKFENIDSLLQDGGEITIGGFTPVPCAATASDADQCLAMLSRKNGESLIDLLHRLDAAIQDALENDNYADEING